MYLYVYIPGHVLHEKGLTESHKTQRWYSGQQPETKSGRRPGDKPVIKRAGYDLHRFT